LNLSRSALVGDPLAFQLTSTTARKPSYTWSLPALAATLTQRLVDARICGLAQRPGIPTRRRLQRLVAQAFDQTTSIGAGSGGLRRSMLLFRTGHGSTISDFRNPIAISGFARGSRSIRDWRGIDEVGQTDDLHTSEPPVRFVDALLAICAKAEKMRRRSR